MALQCGIHQPVQWQQFGGIFADEVRTKFAYASSDTFGIRGKIKRTERADFTCASEAGIGFDFHNGAVEGFHGLAA